jgi:hypothetical protein
MFRVDKERTKHNLWSFLCLFNRHVVYLSTHKVLLSPATLRSRVPSANLRGWLPRPLSITLPWSLHSTLGTVVGIMPQLSALEATTRLNRCGVSHWCTSGIVRAILLLNWRESADESAGAAELNVGTTGSAENFHYILLSETEDFVVHCSGDVHCC